MPRRGALSFLLLALSAVVAPARPADSLPLVQPNDNRTPTGHLTAGVLELRLELREARWYPGDETGIHRDVYAFAESGRDPQSSGPLIRVPEGTRIHANIRNFLPAAARLYGLHRHPGDAKDSLLLAAGETREVQFLVGEPGTYLYWAATSDKPIDLREPADTLLSGAFIVDPPGAQPDDRIFVIGIWNKGVSGSPDFEELPTINGKSWPFTERLTHKIGDSTRWRILNPSFSEHAMHLHGFYFTVEGQGDGERYEHFAPDQRHLAVTELINPGHVFEMSWTPSRPGNWLFHCHMVVHIDAPSPPASSTDPGSPDRPPHDHLASMAGLVLGITVEPGAAPAAHATAPAPIVAARKLQLLISDNPGKLPLYHLELNDPKASAPPAGKSPPTTLLGPPIVLTRGELSEIEIKNASSNPTAIHWHGIELESYYDGVVGWTGSGQQRTPPIPPGTSFVARMTPPRAGTFIYHTHWHDKAQLLNGLYGPLIVLEPGQTYDSEHDRVFVLSMGRYAPFGLVLLVNGHPQPDPIELQTGQLYRLRFINICDDAADLRLRLTAKDAPVQWEAVAKDGADLPPQQRKFVTADMAITVGETYDFEYQSPTPGLAELKVWEPSFPSSVTQPLNFATAK